MNVVAFQQSMSRVMSHQTSNSNRRRIKMQLQFGNRALDSSRGTAAGSRNHRTPLIERRNQGILSTNGFVGSIPNSLTQHRSGAAATRERRSRYTNTTKVICQATRRTPKRLSLCANTAEPSHTRSHGRCTPHRLTTLSGVAAHFFWCLSMVSQTSVNALWLSCAFGTVVLSSVMGLSSSEICVDP